MRKNLFKNLIESSSSGLISKSTIKGVVRSVLTPLCENNTKSIVFTRLRHLDDISGLIKRLEYSNSVEMCDFLNPEVVKNDDFVETEFILLSSPRFNAFLLWDYSNTPQKDKSKIYFLFNSKLINDCFEHLQKRSRVDYSELFHSFKPERRDNTLMNEALNHIVEILNTAQVENDFINKEDIEFAVRTPKAHLSTLSPAIRTACHEIKNQLSIIDIYTKLLEKGATTGAVDKNAEMIRKAILKVTLELNEIKGIAYANSVDVETELVSIIQDVVKTFDECAKANGSRVVFKNNSKKLSVKLNERKLTSVLVNILKNANEVSANEAAAGEITVTLENDENCARVLIKNQGKPIALKDRARIFEDGFTTKENGWGTGLFAVKKFLREMNCTIELTHSDDKYTEFLIQIPLKFDALAAGFYS